MANGGVSGGSWKEPSASAPTGAGPDWRRRRSSTGVRPGRRLRLGLGWLGFIGLCASLIYVSTWLAPPKPASVLLLAANYEDNLTVPLNLAGQRTASEFHQHVAEQKGKRGQLLKLAGNSVQSLRSDVAWDDLLAKVGSEPLVLFIAG